MNLNNFKYGLFIAPAALSISAYAVDYLSESQAQKVLFPQATEFKKLEVTLSDEQLKKVKELSGVRQRSKSPLIWDAYNKKELIGRVYIDEVVGKHEYITYAIGVDVENKITSIEIMSYRETHGGDIKKEEWRKQFKGKKLSDKFKLDEDVMNITGATLSCRNVLDGTKRILNLNKILFYEKNP